MDLILFVGGISIGFMVGTMITYNALRSQAMFWAARAQNLENECNDLRAKASL
jgi:hypothetical protein